MTSKIRMHLGRALSHTKTAFAAAVLCMPAQISHAQQTPIDRLNDALGTLQCDRWVSPDSALLLLSAYADAPVEAVANNANSTVREFVLGGGGLWQMDDGVAFTNGILAGNPGAFEAMLRSIQEDGNSLCPVLAEVERVGLQRTVEMQENVRAYFRPHAEIAQTALNLHGCGAGIADGLFGPGSRAAWTRAGISPVDEGEVPNPGKVAGLLSRLSTEMACTGTQVDFSTVTSAMLDCRSNSLWSISTPRVAWALAQATGQTPTAEELVW